MTSHAPASWTTGSRPNQPIGPAGRINAPFSQTGQPDSSRSFGEHRPAGRASCCWDARGLLFVLLPYPSCAAHSWYRPSLPAAITSHVGNLSVWPALHQLHPGRHPPQPGRTSRPYRRTVRFPSRWPVWVAPSRSRPLAYVLPVAREWEASVWVSGVPRACAFPTSFVAFSGSLFALAPGARPSRSTGFGRYPIPPPVVLPALPSLGTSASARVSEGAGCRPGVGSQGGLATVKRPVEAHGQGPR